MSYKVETEREEHEELLTGVMADWSRQEHDVHLVSIEGHKIFSHKVILSFYSNILREILNEPVMSLSPQPVTISIPASISTIATLLKLLVKGRVGANDREVNKDVKEAARAMGIEMRNCFAEAMRFSSSGAGLKVIKLPLKKQEENVQMKPAKEIPKPLKIVPKSLIGPGPRPIAPKSVLQNNFNTSLIKKSSGLRVELKEFINEETTKSDTNINPSVAQFIRKSTLGKHTCDVCQKGFDEERKLKRHRYRAHGIRKFKSSINVSSVSVKQEKEDKPPQCGVCSKHFHSQEILERHMRKKHGGKRNLKCDVCEKVFNGSSELRTHKLIHLPDSEKPFQCDICGKKFCQSGQRRVHLKKHHGVVEEPGSKVRVDKVVTTIDPIEILNEKGNKDTVKTIFSEEATSNNEQLDDTHDLDTSDIPTDDETGLGLLEGDNQTDSTPLVVETEDDQ